MIDRRSFLALLPSLPAVVSLMVVIKSKFIAPRLMDSAFKADPLRITLADLNKTYDRARASGDEPSLGYEGMIKKAS